MEQWGGNPLPVPIPVISLVYTLPSSRSVIDTMWTTLWAIALASCPLGHALQCSKDDTHQVFEIRQTLVLVSADNATVLGLDTRRQLAEKERLLQTISRRNGRWNEHHPRYRLLEALRGFSAYAQPQLAEVDRLKRLYSHVPKKHKTLLEREVGYSKKFASVAELIAKNEHLCHALVRHALDFYHVDRAELDGHIRQMAAAGRAVDRVSVSQALKHLVRDWAAEGANERDAAFPCILEALGALSSSGGRRPDEPPLRVALPGAGLGRLGHEVSRLGFEVTNNEWSMYQNVVYRFLEAGGRRSHHGVIYPFIDSWSHHKTTSDMLRGVSFPDVPLSHAGDVVLVEGDFTTAFGGETAHFDVVVTHFFIDTARNLMSYFETIVRILKPGGYWINFGPLLYGSAPFVQLSLEEIAAVAKAMGFSFRDAPQGCGTVSLPGLKIRSLDAPYSFDERALTRNTYSAQFWVAQRAW